MKISLPKYMVATGTLLAAGLAQAHPGHGVASLQSGLLHPWSADHLLVMVAVGLWSARALPGARMWQGVASFLAALMAGALLGQAGVQPPLLEHAVALSVALCGVMLAWACRPDAALQRTGLATVAVLGLVHGLAHGAEAPAAGFAAYAAGFITSTVALHLSGLGVGVALRRLGSRAASAALAVAGAGLGVAGLVLLGQAGA